MNRILTLSLLISLIACGAAAQSTSKSKSKERFREKDDRRYPVRIENANVLNQAGTDYAPAYYDNGIIFVSARSKSGPRDEKTKEPYSEHYLSSFDALGKLLPPRKFTFNALKKSSFHEGPVVFSRDFNTVYISRNNNEDGVIKAGKSGRATQKIYELHYGFPDWTKPVELPFNSDDYSSMHPTLSVDGKTLVFASDMPGGFGGYDLYKVTKNDDGSWSAPVNLGADINTDKQELFPFLSFFNTLFFSSNGHVNNLGGMDIFYVNSPLDEKATHEVVNMGEPFNSPSDDHSFIIDDTGHSGYFASDRPELGYGKDDIYQFFATSGIEGTGKPEVNTALINILDKKTGEPMQGAEIRILQPTDDGFLAGNSDFYSLDLVPRQDDPNSLTLTLVRKGAGELGKPDLLSNAAGGATTEFTRYKQYLVIVTAPGYTAREQFVFVDSDKDLKLDFKMSEMPPCLRASGIVLTDDFGTRIANATIKLVHRSTGYSETVRTTWSGEFDACLSTEGEYIAYVERAGFKPENYRMTIAKDAPAFQEMRLTPLESEASAEAEMPLANGLAEGSVLVLDKIFYEYNKTTLNQGAVRYLDALLDIMKAYPDMEIDLLAHTDTRGDARLNMELTQERAKNAKIYLVHKGIDEKRINAVGMGETQPRNHCKEGVECSDEEHQQNNRLEIIVRKLGARK